MPDDNGCASDMQNEKGIRRLGENSWVLAIALSMTAGTW
jgi:hypothetical protein